MLGIKPGNWTPGVVITRFNGLLANVKQELDTAQAVRILGADRVKDLEYFQPANPKLDIDPAIDQSLLSNEILDLYNAFREPIEFKPDDVAADYRPANKSSGASIHRREAVDLVGRPPSTARRCRQQQLGRERKDDSERLPDLGERPPPRARGALAPLLGAPGRARMECGRRRRAGAPGISIGHNEYGAWGLTIFGGDTEDLCVYETNPANPKQYEYRGLWEECGSSRKRFQ